MKYMQHSATKPLKTLSEKLSSYYAEEIGFGVVCEGKSEQQSRVEAIVDDLIWQTNCRICEATDHKLEDDSYGGPESGYMGVRCKRCGWSTGSRLY